MASLLRENNTLVTLVNALGSPLNVILPQQLPANLSAFRSIFSRHRLGGQVFYAHKANRSSALVRELAATEAGIDVASLAELQHALGAGIRPDRIVATGPKNREFLWLAASAGVTVSADSPAELAELAALAPGRVRVPVRLSGFESAGVRVGSRRSRFGVPAAAFGQCLDVIEKHADVLELAGVAFHLDTVGIAEKVVALEGCLTALDQCRDRGLRPWSFDIGGGFGVSYLADQEQWDHYTSALTDAVLGRREPMTWNGHSYGLRSENGVVRGSLGLYPAYRSDAGPAYLDRLLTTDAPALRRPFAELLLDNMLDLHIEPGRALLDQCGLVLATVLEVRDEVVRLDLNARDVSLEDHGVLMDPVLVTRDGPAEPDPAGVFLFGNLCLEADLITRRKVFLPSRPHPGDLLAFVNTAGYLMDFSATHALQQPMARKVAMYQAGGRWQWCLDDQYWPVKAAA